MATKKTSAKPKKYVVANTTFLMPGPRKIRRGALFAADDPVVKGREELFDPVADVVEQATAAPGELRATKPRKRDE